jgi:hypothetical protein
MMLFILLAFIVVSPVRTQTDSAKSDSPEKAVVVIYSRPRWWDRVGITYDHQVNREDALADLKELARLAGWAPDGVTITHEKSTPGSPVMTSVEFNAKAFDAATHSFPIEPVVLAFKRFKKVGAVFLIGKGYPYWGPLNYRTPQVSMIGEAGTGAFTFHFTILDPNVSQFQIPLRDPNAPKAPPQKKATPLLYRFLIVLLMAFVISLIAYVAAWGVTKRRVE